MGKNDDERNNVSQLKGNNGSISSLLLEEACARSPIPVPRGKKIYSNSMKTNRNELVRRLLSGVTKEELEFLVKKREEARRPIPTMRG